MIHLSDYIGIQEGLLGNVGVGMNAMIDKWIEENQDIMDCKSRMYRKGGDVYFEGPERTPNTIYIGNHRSNHYLGVPPYIHFAGTEELKFCIRSNVTSWKGMPTKVKLIKLHYIPYDFEITVTDSLRMADSCMALMSSAKPVKVTWLAETTTLFIDDLYSVRMFKNWEIDCPNSQKLTIVGQKGKSIREIGVNWGYKDLPKGELPEKEQKRLNNIFVKFPQSITLFLGNITIERKNGIWITR